MRPACDTSEKGGQAERGMKLVASVPNVVGLERARLIARDEARVQNHFARSEVARFDGHVLEWHGNTLGIDLRSERARLELDATEVRLTMEYGLARTLPALTRRDRYEAHLSAWLGDLFGRDYEQHDHKVFCVGFQRTGTTSMLDALRRLGYFGHHDVPWLLPSIQAGRPDLSIADDYDALADNPIPLLYRELDEAYPGSRFILTERPTDAWLRSVRYLVEDWAAGFPMEEHIYGVRRFDPDMYRERYERHNHEVRDYFADRPSALLVIDITSSPGWGAVCDFLGVPVPAEPFPRSGQQAT